MSLGQVFTRFFARLSHTDRVETEIPLSSHVMLSSYYNRSLRLHLDTVSLGLTFVPREIPEKHKLSIADKAILEAEGAK